MYTVELYVRGCPEFELRWDAVRKMFQYSATPAYRRGSLPSSPKLDPYRWVTGTRRGLEASEEAASHRVNSHIPFNGDLET